MDKQIQSLLSQSLVNEGRFPHIEGPLGDYITEESQSLVNEGRFPQFYRKHGIEIE